jgi:hypothetical protein
VTVTQNRRSIRGTGTAGPREAAERVPAGKLHASDRDHGSTLPHADDRIVTAVGDIDIDVRFDVGAPGWQLQLVSLVSNDCGGQINRLIKRIGAKATYACNVKNHSVAGEVEGRDGIFERLAGIKKSAPASS